MSPILLCAQVLMSAAVAPFPQPNGYYAVIPYADGFEVLLKVGMDGQTVRTGERGFLGTPQIQDLIWEPFSQQLLGWRSFNNHAIIQWVEISLETGRASVVSQSSFPRPEGANPEGDPFHYPYHCAADPTTGRLYCMVQRYGIVRVNVETGGWSVVHPDHNFWRLTWVNGLLGEFTGFVAARDNKLVYFDPATWQPFPLGGTLANGPGGTVASFWDQNTLFSQEQLYPNGTGKLLAFNEATGSESVAEFHGIQGGYQSAFVEFIPLPMAAAPYCDYTDADFDQDVDLRDFANFSNCMTAPRSSEE